MECIREGLTPDGDTLIVDCLVHGEIGRVPVSDDEYGAAEDLFAVHVHAVAPPTPTAGGRDAHELTADPWAHVPGSAPHIAQVRAVFAPHAMSRHDRRKDGRRGWWVPTSCWGRDAAVDEAGGLEGLSVYSADATHGMTEWGARAGGLPVVADVVTGDACHHLRYVVEP